MRQTKTLADREATVQARIDNALVTVRAACERWNGFDRGKLQVALEAGPIIAKLKKDVREQGYKWEQWVEKNLPVSKRTLARWMKVAAEKTKLEKWAAKKQTALADMTLEQAEAALPKGKPRGRHANKTDPTQQRAIEQQQVMDVIKQTAEYENYPISVTVCGTVKTLLSQQTLEAAFNQHTFNLDLL